MKNIREIISNNLIMLRKHNNLTQIELAKKINYSDKAVSRWEKGEVLPDIETLQNIAKVFNVPLSYLLEEQTVLENGEKNVFLHNEIILQALSVCVAWVILTVLFVYIRIIYDYTFWQAFVWGVPVTAMFCLRFNKKWGNNKAKIICRTVLNWSLLASIYLQFIHLNLWLVFLIGVPVQAAIIVASFSKPITHKE